MTTVRELDRHETPLALALAQRVYEETVAAHVSAAGRGVFYAALADPGYIARTRFYGAYEQGTLVGMLGTQNGGRYIALFFTERRRQGVGRALLRKALAAAPGGGITADAAPGAVEAYRRLGFFPTDGMRVEGGVRYLPMRWGAPCRL